MRLIHTFNDDRYARTFSSFLTGQGIENKLEIEKNTDWGSSEYGNVTCHLWIIEEDDLENSRKWLAGFLENQNDEKFKHLRPVSESVIEDLEKIPVTIAKPDLKPELSRLPPPPSSSFRVKSKEPPLGFATLYLIITCTLILFVSLLTSRSPEPYPSKFPPQPLFLSEMVKELYYDWPHAFEIIDKLVAAYGFEKVIHPKDLPPEGIKLIEQYENAPYWKGVYGKFVRYLQDSAHPIQWEAPLFEKIRQGEVWRLFTPCLLHGGILHLFFNMAWLYVLGKQMEKTLGVTRYLIFIVVTGIFSNTAQYLVSGFNFMGISGVLSAMIVFVWVRMKKAPWEGYQLTPGTIKFIATFIGVLAMAGVVSFFLEAAGKDAFSLPIANTAHLSGALSGLVLARSGLFTWKIRGGKK